MKPHNRLQNNSAQQLTQKSNPPKTIMQTETQREINLSNDIAYWKTKEEESRNIMFCERFVNEIRYFSEKKSELYDIVYKMDDGLANQEDIENAEQCVCEMNACLRSAHELYLHGQEQNFDFRGTYAVTAFNFVKNYEKGNYDTHYEQLCYYLKEKILKSTEL